MGIHGTIVIYPKSTIKGTTEKERREAAGRCLSAMVSVGFMPASAMEVEFDDESTTATGQHIGFPIKPPKGLKWTHAGLDSAVLNPSIGDLVYSDTAKGFWEEKDRKKRDLIAVPTVDVTVFSKALAFRDHDAKKVLEANVLIQFGYYDARLSTEVHTIRDTKHPFFAALSKLLGAKIAWGVISG